ncbi:MAG: TatD family hydrolase, partial [candidate division Zixibacteria bacterium]|nr:TatD family hydrolase [candidate division Zixibacteria bacterium]
NLPVVIHTRESFERTCEIVRDFARDLRGGVFHCFPGKAADAQRVIDMGFIISVGGVITYKNSQMARTAAETPIEHMILETDSPYLTPVPYRGKQNSPANVPYIRDKLAELKDMTPAEIETITDATCRKLYGLAETFEG